MQALDCVDSTARAHVREKPRERSFRLCQHSDVSHSLPGKFTDRFNTLRRNGKLPRGRERREAALTLPEIANAVFGIVSVQPGWAGHSAIILAKLRPVGGAGASFLEAATLSDVVVRLLSDKDALKRFIRLTVTVSETGTNSNGSAVVVYDEGVKRRAYFVPDMAVSQFQPGREDVYDPDVLHSPVSRAMSFNRAFFRELVREIEISKRFPGSAGGRRLRIRCRRSGAKTLSEARGPTRLSVFEYRRRYARHLAEGGDPHQV